MTLLGSENGKKGRNKKSVVEVRSEFGEGMAGIAEKTKATASQCVL